MAFPWMMGPWAVTLPNIDSLKTANCVETNPPTPYPAGSMLIFGMVDHPKNTSKGELII
jgi:hypothetical protein